ncbi:hypothetical protein [Aliivibrio fischeri]|uniref:hypothetical protein n=1 Tax=Aliivibrio fischeri TaxID=668 RepID=UPI00114CAD23|nr:hypothetical protein [Aliivibrio fischeri]
MIILSIFIGNSSVEAKTFLYSDYKNIIQNSAKINIKLFERNDIDADRLVNIVLSLEGNINNTNDILSYIDTLLGQERFSSYRPILINSKVNTLMLAGRYQVALNLMKKQQSRKLYQVNIIIALLEMDRINEAIDVFNSVKTKNLIDNKAVFLSLSEHFILQYQVPKNKLNLPTDMKMALSENLGNFYSKRGFYDLAYIEYRFVSMHTESMLQKRKNLISLTEFAHNNKLISYEIESMKLLLKTFEFETTFNKDDIVIINDFTKKIVLYVYEESNNYSISRKYLIAQSKIARLNTKNNILYLKNKLLLREKELSKGYSYFVDLTNLAKLINNKSIIVEEFDEKYPPNIRYLLLNSYFSIDANDANDIYMASKYSPFIDGCKYNTDIPLVNLFKGHYFIKNEKIEQAYSCYDSVKINNLSLDSQLKNTFLTEKTSINYMYAKKHNMYVKAFNIAIDSQDENMIFDATTHLFKLKSKVPLDKIHYVLDSKLLTISQKQNIKELLLKKLQENGDIDTLKKELLKNPKDNAFDLAWIYLNEDDHKKVVFYLLMGLSENKSIDEYTEIKTVRYLDSRYKELSDEQIKKTSSLSDKYPSISHMLRLNKIESDMNNTFVVSASDSVTQIKHFLQIYKIKIASINKPVSKANYTAQMFLRINIIEQLLHAINQLSLQEKESNIRKVLVSQAENLHRKKSLLYKHLMAMKIEGIFDRRILLAFKHKG